MGRMNNIQQAINEKMKYECPHCAEYSLEIIDLNYATCHSSDCNVNDAKLIEKLIDEENFKGGFTEWELFSL